MLVVSGWCLPYAESVPFLPVADVLGALDDVDGRRLVITALDHCPPFVRGEMLRLFTVDAGTSVCSAVVVILFGRGGTEQHPGALAGLRLIARERGLRLPVLAGMVSLVGIGITDVASYPLSLNLGGGTAGYGVMTALLGGGGLLGAALAGRVVPSGPARVLAAESATSASGLALAGAAPSRRPRRLAPQAADSAMSPA